MPYYHEKLLSAWPSHMIFEVGAPPPQIDPSILSSLRPAEVGAYAPNPKKTRRYQIESTRAAAPTEAALAAPKFLSEKARETQSRDSSSVMDAAEALSGARLNGISDAEILAKYRNVEIKYSKFGVEDFDFGYTGFFRSNISWEYR